MDVSVSGSGNAVTAISKSGTTISVTKGITFLTSHQSLDGYVNEVATSGTGNAITSVSKSGKKLVFTKGATFLTSHQSLSEYLTTENANNTFLKLSGGTMSGDLTVNGNIFTTKLRLPTIGEGYIISGSKDSDGSDFASVNCILKNWWSLGIASYDNIIRIVFNSRNGDIYLKGKLSAESLSGNLSWNNITDRPGSYTPSAHTHKWAEITDRITNVSQLTNDMGYQTGSNRWTRAVVNANDIYEAFHTYETNGGSNMPNNSSWHQIFAWGTGDINYCFQLANDYVSNNHLYFRYKCAGTWYDWKTVIDSSNIGSQSVNYANSAGNADTVDGVHVNQLCRIYTFNVHNSIIKVGTLTSGQSGHVCKLRFNSGIGFNAVNTDKTITVVIRASNGGANSNGFYFEAHSESYRGGAFTIFYLHQTSKTQCELYMAAFDYSGQSTYEVSFSNGDSWANEISVQNALPTSNIFTLPNYQIAYTDYNVASATKLQTPRTIWGQSFDGTGNVDGNIYTSGSILAKGGVTAYQSSDVRLKTNITKLNCLNVIKSIGGTYEFDYIRDNKHSIGWIAQHVLNNPYMSDIVETDENGYYKINYWSPKLIATAFGAIEQVGDEVSRLKARVVFLESEVQRLSGKQDSSDKKRLDNKNINLLN